MSLQTWHETLITSQGDGTTLTAAAAATAIPAAAKYTLPQNYFSIGKQIRIVASGRLSVLVTTPGTLRLDIRFGGTIVFDSLAMTLVTANAYTNVGWYFEVLLTCRVIGTTGNLMGQGYFTAPNLTGSTNAAMPLASLSAMLPWNSAPAVGSNFDTTTTQQIDMFFTQTVATGSFTVHQYAVISQN